MHEWDLLLARSQSSKIIWMEQVVEELILFLTIRIIETPESTTFWNLHQLELKEVRNKINLSFIEEQRFCLTSYIHASQSNLGLMKHVFIEIEALLRDIFSSNQLSVMMLHYIINLRHCLRHGWEISDVNKL